ncbi:MAG: penicillin-binding protein 2 [Candidatus Paceibacterota bacterium]|jgi:cell division protein FtsI/penicillin-binding protein 2
MTRRRFFPHQRKEVNYQKKISFIKFAFIVFFLILISRLFSLQIQHYSDFTKQAEAIHDTTAVLAPDRGLIYCQDKNNNRIPLAINKKYYTLYAVPQEIHDPQKISQELSQLISLSYDEIYSHLNKPADPYELLFKKIDDDILINKIKEAQLEGIHIASENYRFYPLGNSASQTIGFVAEGDDGKIKGRYGLELYYDGILSGESGVFQGVRDAFGRLIRSVFSQEKQVKEGADIVVTIDKNIQLATEKSLESLIQKRQATQGSIIVMEVKTGKILALANYPTFDLNEFSKVKDYSIFRNLAIEERYEPGSIIKPITMAAGLDIAMITPETTYVDKGYYEVGGYKIVNYNNEVYGKATMTKVLERSINTGAIFVAQKLGLENLRKYFKAFGFIDRTGIDLPNEITGDLSNLEYPKANSTYLSTASYGGGIAVSPIALLKAYATIANKGETVIPYLIESINDDESNHLNAMLSESKRVISEETAETLTLMLVSVIDNGFGGNAKVKGYSLAGKTGTAYISLDKSKGYSEDAIHTFAGFFPASNPRFVILVKMDRPQFGAEAASYTVTIAFREVEQFLINYYNIPPDEE